MMEVMLPIMMTGMFAGMFVSMAITMTTVGFGEAMLAGASIGFLVFLLTYFANYMINGRLPT